MNLFDILSHDERVIVLSDVGQNVIVTWNRSLTLQYWQQRGGRWHECDVRTLSTEPSGYAAARSQAQKWCNE
jgi:hypothetical protein